MQQIAYKGNFVIFSWICKVYNCNRQPPKIRVLGVSKTNIYIFLNACSLHANFCYIHTKFVHARIKILKFLRYLLFLETFPFLRTRKKENQFNNFKDFQKPWQSYKKWHEKTSKKHFFGAFKLFSLNLPTQSIQSQSRNVRLSVCVFVIIKTPSFEGCEDLLTKGYC